MFEITKEFAFEAAHHLPQMPDGHQCKRPHGHSYRVIVTLRSEGLDSFGFVRDFGELSFIKDDLDRHYDHQDLAVVRNSGEHTTAERLAEHFFFRWVVYLDVKLHSVTVCETAKTTATFTRPEYKAPASQLTMEQVRELVLRGPWQGVQ